MKVAVIKADKISVGYPKTMHQKGIKLHTDLSFDLYSGELTCLLGPNGAGKSTLLRTLGAMQPCLGGSLILDEKSLHDYDEEELSTRIGVVLTDKTSVSGFTVEQLVALGRYPYTGFFGKLSSYDKSVVNKAMVDVCIVHKANAYIAELSDGERQKVMIAKALAQESSIIILDEPTAFLDVVSRIEIMQVLHRLATTQNKAILLSTHDVDSALLFADKLWLLSKDNGLMCGVTEDILLDNSMNLFLAKDGILFDKQTGNFIPYELFEKQIYLEAEEHLYYWVKNFLRRNGWGITNNAKDAIYSLKVYSKDNLCIETNDLEMTLFSFDELYDELQKIK